MSASVTWTGLEELRAELRKLPADLTAEATHLVEGAANGALADVYAAYPSRSGNLRQHLTMSAVVTSAFGVRFVVKNTARHAWLYDNGSQTRQFIEKSGTPHKTGAMWGRDGAEPPTHVFVKSMIRARARMYQQLTTMLIQHGLTVTGEP
ncbi:MAG: hypothetical protein ABI665_14655 [Vicinamibacterales bacterium]